MKLVRYGSNGREKPALIDAAGRLRDLSGQIESIGWNELAPQGLKRLAALRHESLRHMKR